MPISRGRSGTGKVWRYITTRGGAPFNTEEIWKELGDAGVVVSKAVLLSTLADLTANGWLKRISKSAWEPVYYLPNSKERVLVKPQWKVGDRVRYRMPNGNICEGEILRVMTWKITPDATRERLRWLVTYPWRDNLHASGYVHEGEILGLATGKYDGDGPWPGRYVPKEEL